MTDKERSRNRWVLLAVPNDEEVWRSWAASLAVAATLLVVVAVIWISHAHSERMMATRVAIIAPFGVVYVALITFCTVVWRGLISARQADTQQQQLESLAKQIAATEENNLAQLLQKGAELLADGGRAHQSAGVATLQAVIDAENTKFVREGMELIADFIDERFQSTNENPIFRSAIAALEIGHAKGFVARRSVDFSSASPATAWVPFCGVTEIRYIRGLIVGYDDIDIIEKNINLKCDGVIFRNGRITRLDRRFNYCTFVECSIEVIALDKNSVANFERCNFSGAVVDGSVQGEFSFRDCYFSKNNPPQFPPEWFEELSILEEPDIKLNDGN